MFREVTIWSSGYQKFKAGNRVASFRDASDKSVSDGKGGKK
jgi:hypothetical protein